MRRHVIDKRQPRGRGGDPWWDYKTPEQQRNWFMQMLRWERHRLDRRYPREREA